MHELAASLTDQVLASVHVHRLMTTPQVDALVPSQGGITQTRRRLQLLEREGLVGALPRRRRNESKIWYVTPSGADIAGADPDHARSYLVPASVMRRASRNLIAHTLAVNEIGLAFHRHAAGRGDEFGLFGWEHEVAHSFNGEVGSASPAQRRTALIVDAVVSYTAHLEASTRLVRRFVEMDRGTEPLHVLHDKVRRYATYRDRRDRDARPVWRRWYESFPPLLIVLGANTTMSARANRRRIRQLAELVNADPSTRDLELLLGEFDDLRTHGPGAGIWLKPGSEALHDFFGEVRS